MQLDSPLDTTRSLLHFLRTHLHAVAEGDGPAAAAARDQVVWHIADREDLRARYETASGIRLDREAKRIQLWRSHVESWAAIVSAYADDLEADRAVVIPGPGDDRAMVRVPAQHGDDTATLRVFCSRSATGAWLVQRIDFEPRRFPPAGSRSTTRAARPDAP